MEKSLNLQKLCFHLVFVDNVPNQIVAISKHKNNQSKKCSTLTSTSATISSEEIAKRYERNRTSTRTKARLAFGFVIGIGLTG